MELQPGPALVPLQPPGEGASGGSSQATFKIHKYL